MRELDCRVFYGKFTRTSDESQSRFLWMGSHEFFHPENMSFRSNSIRFRRYTYFFQYFMTKCIGIFFAFCYAPSGEVVISLLRCEAEVETIFIFHDALDTYLKELLGEVAIIHGRIYRYIHCSINFCILFFASALSSGFVIPNQLLEVESAVIVQASSFIICMTTEGRKNSRFGSERNTSKNLTHSRLRISKKLC